MEERQVGGRIGWKSEWVSVAFVAVRAGISNCEKERERGQADTSRLVGKWISRGPHGLTEW